MSFAEWSNAKKKREEEEKKSSQSSSPTSSLPKVSAKKAKSFSEWSDNKVGNNSANKKPITTQDLDFEKKKTYDLIAGREELDFLESIQKEANRIRILNSNNNGFGSGYGYSETGGATLPTFSNSPTVDNGFGNVNNYISTKVNERLKEIDALLKEKGYSGLDDLDKIVSDKKVFYNQAERVQKSIELSSAVNNPDFNEYAQQGIDMADDATWGGFKNNIVAYRGSEGTKAAASAMRGGAGSLGEDVSFARAMTDDEVKVYSYYLAKEGKKKAKE
jgi:hypothetical protein